MFKSIDDGMLPLAKTRASAGYDVFSNEDITLYPGRRILLHLGVAIDPEAVNELEADFCGEFAENFYFGLYIRSSVAMRGVYMPNGVGVIDMDYFDEIRMPLAMPSDEQSPFKICRGMSVGQLILQRHFGVEIMKSAYRSPDERNGGFGSTGIF